MFTFLAITTAVIFFLLVLVSGVRPAPHLVSQFELQRRSRASKQAKAQHRRELLLPDVYALIGAKTAVLLVAFILLSVAAFGWIFGVIVAVVGALLFPVLSRLGVMHGLSMKLYVQYEERILDTTEKMRPVFKFVKALSVPYVEPYHRFDSREELQRLIQASGDVLTDDERMIIVSGLSFKDKTVESVMTPKNVVKTVKKSEFLGPLVLSEIHELGHSRLPVINRDIDHVVGVLHINNLLSLDIRKSLTAEKAMDPKVFYIRHDDSLQHALAAFIESRRHLFIVINEYRETVGILTLEDVMEALIGRRIVDEDDNHEDLRSIALKKAQTNNSPARHVDL